MPPDCWVVACPPDGRASSLHKELELIRSQRHFCPDAHLLTVEDPAPVAGSGAATLNALLVAAEFLSLHQGYSVVTADVLHRHRIFILHHGRKYLWESRGKAFVELPDIRPEEEEESQAHVPDSCLQRLLEMMEKVSEEEESGIWMCSTDAILRSSSLGWQIKEKKEADAKLYYVLADAEYAAGHGAIKMDSDGLVRDIIYCGNKEDISGCLVGDSKVPVVAGVVYLSSRVAESLLTLHAVSPLDSCNYMGLDSGAEPLQVSLFFDILIAMALDVSKESFLSGRCGKMYNKKFGISIESEKRMRRARNIVWEHLSQYKMVAVHLQNYSHTYLSEEENGKQHIGILREVTKERIIHSYLQPEKIIVKDSILLNSWLNLCRDGWIDPGSVLYHVRLDIEFLHVGSNCFLNGLKLCSPNTKIVIPDNSVIISFNVSLPNEESSFVRINVVFGCDDMITVPFSDNRSTFCNHGWNCIFERMGICADDIWDQKQEDDKKTLLNAKLYWVSDEISEHLLFFKQEKWNKDQYQRWKNRERFSISDILKHINYEEEFQCRRELYASVTLKEITRILLNNCDNPVLPYFQTAHVEGWDKRVLNVLDEVCVKSTTETEVMSRTLSCIADLLGIMAGKLGGVRSGPGNNKLWISAFNLLQEGKMEAGLQALRDIRDQWLDHPHRIIRAARHYESALQIIIRRAVATANLFVRLSKIPLLPFGQWVVVECPARVDLQGGWSDTPPICYELGGSVVNMAVLVDGKKPIGGKACRIPELEIIMNLGEDEGAPTIVVNDVNQLTDYNQPNAEGALLKAAVVYVGLVEVEGGTPLSQQLRERYGGGFRIGTWSLLPRGSGLGTSSIMASAVLAVLWTVAGRSYDTDSLTHAVLQLEQLLTTGGGWQDQVGGVVGGIKRGFSQPGLPLHVEIEEVRVSEEFLKRLEDHFLLVYTGKVRLAKNLLQNVIRNWYAREEKAVNCFHSLIDDSSRMVRAFDAEDLDQIGKLMNAYWERKQLLAPGCRPDLVAEMMEALQPLTYGRCLAGAGGGGFMYLLTKRPCDADSIRNVISQIQGTEKVEVYPISVCRSSLDPAGCARLLTRSRPDGTK